MVTSVDALVIRVSESGENDKRLCLLTAERGKVYVSAKGVRSYRNGNAAATALFTYGNFELSERSGRAWIGNSSVLESFYGLRDDIDKLSLASYVLEVVNELTGEEEPAPEMLRLALNILYAISENKKPPKLIKAVFEFRAMAMSGYAPNLSECVHCGRERAEYMYLDVMRGELSCAECLHSLESKNERQKTEEDPIETILSPMAPATLAVARYILDAPTEKILSFSLDERPTSELSRFAEAYLLHHLERSFDSLDFYHSLSKLGK